MSMTGPEHYARAEEFLDNVQSMIADEGVDGDEETMAAIGHALAAAQVHATLAVAAATVTAAAGKTSSDTAARWRAALEPR